MESPCDAATAAADGGEAGFSRQHIVSLGAGVALCAGIALAAIVLQRLSGVAKFSPMILSILLGIAVRNMFRTPAAAAPGIAFAMRRILRAGIILLGFQVTVQQLAGVGAAGLVIVSCSVMGCFIFTLWAGRVLGVDAKLTQLIAAGTSICGASAVIATNSVTAARDEDASYAVVCVTSFGALAMFVYPLIGAFFDLGARDYGLWSGASIHEVAQVVAAAYERGKMAGDLGTVTKLARVLMLAPMVLALGAIARRSMGFEGKGRTKAPAPWFVFGFLLAAIANSVIPIPLTSKPAMAIGTTFLLSVALAALGLETDLRRVRAMGSRPLILAGVATLFISALSFALVKALA